MKDLSETGGYEKMEIKKNNVCMYCKATLTLFLFDSFFEKTSATVWKRGKNNNRSRTWKINEERRRRCDYSKKMDQKRFRFEQDEEGRCWRPDRIARRIEVRMWSRDWSHWN